MSKKITCNSFIILAAPTTLGRTRDCGMPRVGFCRALPTTLRKQRYAVRLRAEGHKKQPTKNKDNAKVQINRGYGSNHA
nr:MAG TPA: hypothetical protein [Caudoviricetes sp.]